MYSLHFTLSLLVGLAGQAIAECQSSGYDFVDGGGPYCINTTSNDWFSFGTVFRGDGSCHTASVSETDVDKAVNRMTFRTPSRLF